MSEIRLIDANALKEEIESRFTFVRHITNIIDNAPTVEPEQAKEGELVKAYTKGFDAGVETARPQGEWITFPTNHSIMQCPECTALLNNLRVDVFKDKVGNMNFCPNCGADMRGRQNENSN